MSIVGYITPGKGKARILLDAFCAGAGGKVVSDVTKLQDGDAAFYGVVGATKAIWRQAHNLKRNVFYMDNAYFDSQREVYFRITRNRLQHSGFAKSNGKRFKALNIEIKPWRKTGKHIVVCPQSDQFMRDVVGYYGYSEDWLRDTLQALKAYTDRPVIVRPWNGNKREWYRTLPADLVNAHALVTYSSASAITAILSGVPAICTATDTIARTMAGHLHEIENPPMYDCRKEWAGVVADNQWTLEEMRNGTAWRMLNE